MSELRRVLLDWQAGRIDVIGVKDWVEEARAPDGDRAAAAVLAELDLLEIHLLTSEDVPALLRLLDGGSLDEWARYRDAIDLDARSKQLKRDLFYRPFCR